VSNDHPLIHKYRTVSIDDEPILAGMPYEDADFIDPMIVRSRLKKPGRRPGLSPGRRRTHLSEEQEKAIRQKEIIAVMRGKTKLQADFKAKYALTEVLGDGAFGFVFAARIVGTSREAAVKFIIKDKVQDDAWVADDRYGSIPFEAHFLAQVRHPNIIRFLDVYQDTKYVYLVTELAGDQWHPANPKLDRRINKYLKPVDPGMKPFDSRTLTGSPEEIAKMSDSQLLQRRRVASDLFECIEAHNGFPEDVSRKIFVQVVDAVKYMHDCGYVHRDIKDENIVITADYSVKLIDFGSTSAIPPTKDGWFDRFNGTLHFAAPEILKGSPYRGPEAEVWALGVLLYTILYSENPFSQPDAAIHCRPKKLEEFPDKPSSALMRRMMNPYPYMRATLDQVRNHYWMTQG
jgi:serine/threonine protein kinase